MTRGYGGRVGEHSFRWKCGDKKRQTGTGRWSEKERGRPRGRGTRGRRDSKRKGRTEQSTSIVFV